MDDAAANWYEYHFHDTLFLNDTFWVTWHVRLLQLLTPQQLEGQACAFCGTAYDKDMDTEHLAGFRIVCCREPCHIKLEPDNE